MDEEIKFYYGDDGIVVKHPYYLLDPRITEANYSLSFDWGNGLSAGARQLSFAWILDVLGKEDADKYCEAFAREFVSKLPKKWTVTSLVVIKICSNLETAEKSDNIKSI